MSLQRYLHGYRSDVPSSVGKWRWRRGLVATAWALGGGGLGWREIGKVKVEENIREKGTTGFRAFLC